MYSRSVAAGQAETLNRLWRECKTSHGWRFSVKQEPAEVSLMSGTVGIPAVKGGEDVKIPLMPRSRAAA